VDTLYILDNLICLVLVPKGGMIVDGEDRDLNPAREPLTSPDITGMGLFFGTLTSVGVSP
jgi:hypothetical protein